MARIPSIQPSQSRFATVPQAEIPRSSFDRSHGHKTTFKTAIGRSDDRAEKISAVAGIVLSAIKALNMTGFARLATPLHPFMDNLFMNTFFFAVPIRLLWSNWERFNGAQDDPGDSTDFLCPVVTPPDGGFEAGSMADYFGIPTKVAGITPNAFHFRAYNLIWNEWFRDQNLQDSLPVPKGDGPDPASNYVLKKRGKRHDYFTSCLPWPQKGDSVDIPIGQYAPISGDITFSGNGASPTFSVPGDSNFTNANLQVTGSGSNANYSKSTSTGGNKNVVFGNQIGIQADASGLVADLSEAAAATINQLRQAFQIQKLYERDARGGTRYTEIVRSHFGVISPDARLQRPEYLGGGQSPVNLYTVPQTSNVTGQPTPQGNLAAYGTSTLNGHGFTKSFTEHCVIIGLVAVRADLTYQQGLNRMFSRRTRWDYYWPALAHIGEQAVLNKEIFAQGTAADDQVFGYQERFAEYRYKPSVITGEMRSNFPQSLDTWHLSQDFDTLPVLNASFIEDNPPVDRVIAVPSSPHFIFDSYFALRCARPMPVYGVPGMIDHF